MKTDNVILIIADISGYTRFMLDHQKALVHGQMVISELMQFLVQQIKPPLEMVELEGDAVLMYALKGSDPGFRDAAGTNIGRQLLELFAAFKAKTRELQAYGICMCKACANIEKLKLKIIVHSGEAVFSKIGPFSRLSGVDVIVVHRLLKNSVEADEYILMTEPAMADIQFPEKMESVAGQEDYDVGAIKTHVCFPDAGKTGYAQDTVSQAHSTSPVGLEILRYEIQREYGEVANHPDKGFHFHTGGFLAQMLEYDPHWCEAIPAEAVASFAGTGNPFALGEIQPGDHVVDVGSGAGFDSLIAAHLVGPTGRVVGVDMTAAMLHKAEMAATATGMRQVEFKHGYAESLPLPDEWADVVISNGVINLCPDKPAVFREMYRVLKPGGRLQVADLLIQKAIPEDARKNVDLWTG